MNVVRPRPRGVLCLIAAGAALCLPAAAAPIPSPERNEAGGSGAGVPIRTWEAPRYYQPPVVPAAERATSPESPTAVSSAPLIFVAVAPCRILDTRGLTPPNPAYGAPALSHQSTREFQVTGSCGIPAGAAAVSANATIVTPVTAGYLALWDGGSGSAWPGNSTMNWTAAGVILANAAVVPLSAAGTINALAYVPPAGSTTDFLLDVNGYYTSDPMTGPYVRYFLAVNQSIPSGTNTVVNFGGVDTVSADASGLVTTGASWHFTAPRAGIYEVMAAANLQPGTWSVDTRTALVALVNSNLRVAFGMRGVKSAFTDYVMMDGAANVTLAVGDQLSIALYQTSGTTQTVVPSPASWVVIRFLRPYP
jgi:hypothetical protein